MMLMMRDIYPALIQMRAIHNCVDRKEFNVLRRRGENGLLQMWQLPRDVYTSTAKPTIDRRDLKEKP